MRAAALWALVLRRTVAVPGPLDSDCWEWMGARGGQDKQGRRYGVVKVGRRLCYVHRLVWALFHGPIRAGRVVRHRCDNPPCCNPAHLQGGSTASNARDYYRRGRWARGLQVESPDIYARS